MQLQETRPVTKIFAVCADSLRSVRILCGLCDLPLLDTDAKNAKERGKHKENNCIKY
jgi:hypothetical protein